jgi:hypothetical protein
MGVGSVLLLAATQWLYAQQGQLSITPSKTRPQIAVSDSIDVSFFAKRQYSEDSETLKRFQLQYKAQSCPTPHDINFQQVPGQSNEPNQDCFIVPLGEIDKIFKGDKDIYYYYLPPFESFSPEADKNLALPSWTPARLVKNGTELIEEWESLARAQSLLNCQPANVCSLYVYATEDQEVSGKFVGDHTPLLALCAVNVIDEKRGVPHNCQIKVVYYEEPYMQAINSWPRFSSVKEFNDSRYRSKLPLCGVGCSQLMGRMDFNFTIVGPFSVGQILSVIAKSIAASPLSLETAIEDRAVIGQSDQRASQILAPYHEWPFVRIDSRLISWPKNSDEAKLFSEKRPGPPANSKAWEIIVSTTLLVNRRPTSDNHEWHPADRDQDSTYVRAVNSAIQKALSELCKGPDHDGYTSLICH